jgi:hypothetical protein
MVGNSSFTQGDIRPCVDEKRGAVARLTVKCVSAQCREGYMLYSILQFLERHLTNTVHAKKQTNFFFVNTVENRWKYVCSQLASERATGHEPALEKAPHKGKNIITSLMTTYCVTNRTISYLRSDASYLLNRQVLASRRPYVNTLLYPSVVV